MKRSMVMLLLSALVGGLLVCIFVFMRPHPPVRHFKFNDLPAVAINGENPEIIYWGINFEIRVFVKNGQLTSKLTAHDEGRDIVVEQPAIKEDMKLWKKYINH